MLLSLKLLIIYHFERGIAGNTWAPLIRGGDKWCTCVCSTHYKPRHSVVSSTFSPAADELQTVLVGSPLAVVQMSYCPVQIHLSRLLLESVKAERIRLI